MAIVSTFWLFVVTGWILEVFIEFKETDDPSMDYSSVWGFWIAPIMCVVLLVLCNKAKVKIESEYKRDLSNAMEQILRNVKDFI